MRRDARATGAKPSWWSSCRTNLVCPVAPIPRKEQKQVRCGWVCLDGLSLARSRKPACKMNDIYLERGLAEDSLTGGVGLQKSMDAVCIEAKVSIDHSTNQIATIIAYQYVVTYDLGMPRTCTQTLTSQNPKLNSPEFQIPCWRWKVYLTADVRGGQAVAARTGLLDHVRLHQLPLFWKIKAKARRQS
jgi:hypothetical protein